MFKEIRASGAQLELLGDGDVSEPIWAAKDDAPFDLLMGIGAAPEGVISATAIRGLGACSKEHLSSAPRRSPCGDMIDDDLTRLWKAHDLCQSEDAIFAASGVCDGYLPAAELGDGFAIAHSEIIDVQAKLLNGSRLGDHCDSMSQHVRIQVRLPEGHWPGDVSLLPILFCASKRHATWQRTGNGNTLSDR